MAKKKKDLKPTSYVALDETSRALLDASLESAIVIDSSGYVLAANHAANIFFGLKNGKNILHSNIYDLLPEDTAKSRRKKSKRRSKPANPCVLKRKSKAAHWSILSYRLPIPGAK